MKIRERTKKEFDNSCMVSSFMSYKILVRKHLNYIIFAPIIVEGSKKIRTRLRVAVLSVRNFICCLCWYFSWCRCGRHCGVAVDDTVPFPALHCALQAISHYLFLISLPENYSKTFRIDASGKPFITAHIFKHHFKKN